MEVNHELSLPFYNYLCKVVGSEDVVNTRRRIFNADDFVRRTNAYTFISSGSKAEGLDLPGSDFDFMVAVHDSVYENIDDINYTQERFLPSFIIDRTHTKPGYSRLELYYMNQTHSHIDYETFLSNEVMLELFTSEGLVIHGPCRSDPGGHVDCVVGLHCKKWISQADKWIDRSRSSWPHNRLIETIVQYGVLFVPVGCKNSPGKEYEFRISFNAAEKILVHSFSHVQLLCYALLKIILNHFIKPQYKDLMCSYFLKTIMFWVSEETEQSTWKPHHFLRCFDRCFKKLVYCVTFSTCLHYFIPELNFFEDRFSKSEHEALTGTVQRLYNSGWQVVLQTNLLSPFIYSFGPSATRTVLTASALQSVFYVACKDDIVYRSIFGSLNLPGKQIYAFILSRNYQRLAQITSVHYTDTETNNQKYRNYRKILSNLLQGIHHDAVSGWLLLASFFYKCQQYQFCLHILNYCLPKCTPDKILISYSISAERQYEFNTEMQQHLKNMFLRSCKRRVLDLVMFHKESCILPTELSACPYAKNQIVFPPVVFGHLLHCFCLHRIDCKAEKMNALCDLEKTVQDLYFINNTGYAIYLSYECIKVARKLFSE